MSILIQIPREINNPEVLSMFYKNIEEYNPDQTVIIIESQQDLKNIITWNNSDKELRDWWRENSLLVSDDIIYLFLYSHVIEGKLPVLSENYDLVSRTLSTIDRNKNLSYVKSIREILDKNQNINIMPNSYGFYIIRRWVLDAISDPKYDIYYDQDIKNEIRMPTVAALCGAKLGRITTKSPKVNPLIKEGIKKELEKQKNNTKTSGVGSELSKTLEIFGIKATPNCSCKKRAKLMDTNGIAWCEKNKDTIVGWLEEEAKKRKLIFSKTIARILLNRAIQSAKNDPKSKP
jgi:hypothetical protein